MRYLALLLMVSVGHAEEVAPRYPAPETSCFRFPERAPELVQEVQGLRDEARRKKDIVLLAAVQAKLQELRALELAGKEEWLILRQRRESEDNWFYCTKIALIYARMAALRDRARELAGEALWYVGGSELDVESEPSSVGVGLVVGALRLRGEIELPASVMIGLLARWSAHRQLELAGNVGPLLTGGDLEGKDPVGLFALGEVRILDALGQLDGPDRWLNPLFGYHLVVASIDWSNGDFFLHEQGTHVGLLLPLWDAGRFVVRYGIGAQSSERSDGRTNHVLLGTLEVRLW